MILVCWEVFDTVEVLICKTERFLFFFSFSISISMDAEFPYLMMSVGRRSSLLLFSGFNVVADLLIHYHLKA